MPATHTFDTTFTLASTCALEQLHDNVSRLDAPTFNFVWRPILGMDIAPEHYSRLHQALTDRTLPNAVHLVTDALPVSTQYDAASDVIEVSHAAIKQALEDPHTTPGLLTALLQGFGRYIRAVLERYKAENIEGDAPPSVESAPDGFSVRFVQTLLFYSSAIPQDAEFAQYRNADTDHALLLQLPTGRPPQALRFSAGKGSTKSSRSFGHESIEQTLASVGFNETERKAIYFGNWLRDYSQIIDPKIVAPHDAAPADFLKTVTGLLQGTVPGISRDTLTAVVDLLALKEFNSLQMTAQGREDYRVTPNRLGVYRAHEHIDNPVTLERNTPDPTKIDPDFSPLVFEDSHLNRIMPRRSIKKYIRRPMAYMKRKLEAAQKAGRTPEGLRHFGEALHVLEDYFAHSNYVELLLRKLGHSKVLVWTTRIESREESKHEWPVVTGLFGALDIVGSVLDPLANALYPEETPDPRQSGERTDAQKVVLILLRDQPEVLSSAYLAYLKARDALLNNPFGQAIIDLSAIFDQAKKSVDIAAGLVKRPLLKWAGDEVGSLQVYLNKDPNVDSSATATHSQLAKDHDTHPFHSLAAALASEAVRVMGQAMSAYWNGDTSPSKPLHQLAADFIVHPNESKRFDAIAQEWAQHNPDKIADGESLDTLRKLQTDELNELVSQLGIIVTTVANHIKEVEERTNTSFGSYTDYFDVGPGYGLG